MSWTFVIWAIAACDCWEIAVCFASVCAVSLSISLVNFSLFLVSDCTVVLSLSVFALLLFKSRVAWFVVWAASIELAEVNSSETEYPLSSLVLLFWLLFSSVVSEFSSGLLFSNVSGFSASASASASVSGVVISSFSVVSEVFSEFSVSIEEASLKTSLLSLKIFACFF